MRVCKGNTITIGRCHICWLFFFSLLCKQKHPPKIKPDPRVYPEVLKPYGLQEVAGNLSPGKAKTPNGDTLNHPGLQGSTKMIMTLCWLRSPSGTYYRVKGGSTLSPWSSIHSLYALTWPCPIQSLASVLSPHLLSLDTYLATNSDTSTVFLPLTFSYILITFTSNFFPTMWPVVVSPVLESESL